MLTALLLYFGRLHLTGLTQYFGLQYSVLDLSSQDYLVRSADGLVLPAVIAACVVLLALWGNQILTRALGSGARQKALLVVIPVAATLGSSLIALALLDAFGVDIFGSFGEGRGLSLALGAPLLVYSVRLIRFYLPAYHRGRQRGAVSGSVLLAEWVAVLVLVSVGLFWAIGTYAVGVGTGRAEQLQAMLPTMPDTVVFSDKDLDLDQPGVRAQPCTRPDHAYGFRYDGLRFVLQSSNQYLLLPAGWTPDAGAAILLPRRDGIRLEFNWSSEWRPNAC